MDEEGITRHFWCSMCKLKRKNSNKEIYDGYNAIDIVKEIKKRKIQWLSHVERIVQSGTGKTLLL